MKKMNLSNWLIALVVGVGLYTVAKHFYMKPAFDGGEKAPDFVAMLPDNQAFKLSELKGRYILIDFWGSWCGPCITEAPELIGLYEKYREAKFKDAEGFDMVGVAIEKDKTRWLAAIDRLGLNWPYQVLDPASSLKFFDSPIANDYDVKQLPTNFFLDGNRHVIGIDMPIAEIDRYLHERKIEE